jgi:hypothetical protein
MKHVPHVHRKKAKGRTYYYFDLGRDNGGKRILKRLPDVRHRDFPAALAAAKAMRTKGEKANGAKTFDWLVKLYERSPDFRAKAENTKRLYSRHLAYANENFRNRLLVMLIPKTKRAEDRSDGGWFSTIAKDCNPYFAGMLDQ